MRASHTLAAAFVLLLLAPGASGQPDPDRAAKLLELAEARFGGELTDADRTLFRAVANGEVADYGGGDTAEGDTWGPERTLQADRIRWLCTDPEAVKLVLRHAGIAIEGARIDGQLRLSFVQLDFPLAIMRSSIRQGVVMQCARLAGLYLNGTHTGPINADGLRVDHALHMRDGFRADGEVRLLNATVGENLDCSKARVGDPSSDGYALAADRVKVTGSVGLGDGFRADGEVRLLGATIGGDLECENGHFSNPKPGGYALNADRVKVRGDLFLRNGFRADGEVSLLDATIGGQLSCDNGHFSNRDAGDRALNAQGIEVTGSMYLRRGFQAQGIVDLTDARVDGWFCWTGVNSPGECTLLLLEGAQIGTLSDEEASWPKELALDGLVYDRLARLSPLAVKPRVYNWIRRHSDGQYLPQPYEQLAKVLKEMGHEGEARKVLIAKNQDRARLKGVWWPGRVGHGILGVTIRYGYRPEHALIWMLIFLAAGTVLFSMGEKAGLLPDVKEGASPAFCAFVYSLDSFVPVVDLYQAKYRLPTGFWLRLYHWVHICAGWVLTTLLVVGLTGLVRR